MVACGGLSVIVADPGAGKTMGIRDLLKTAGKRSILAVVTPKNNEEEQALGDRLFTALGLPLRGHWRTRKPKLMGHLHQYGTECLIVDDAHDLSLEHLMFLKELTDQGAVTVRSSAWVMPGGRWARGDDPSQRDVSPAFI